MARLPAVLIAAAVATACAPTRIEPAVGTSISFSYCGTTGKTGVHVFHRNAPCPDMDSLDLRFRTVEQRTGALLAGAKLYVTAAYVSCGDAEVTGCASGDAMTVTHSPTVLGTAQHEAMHVAYERRGNVLGSYYVDHPEERSGLRRHTGGDAP